MGRLEYFDWTQVPLGLVPDRQIARMVGCAAGWVGRVRRARDLPPAYSESLPLGIDWDEQPLGRIPDALLARYLGVSSVAVGSARKRRKIACFRPARSIRGTAIPLGSLPDWVLARQMGVDRACVGAARERLGITRFDRVPGHWRLMRSPGYRRRMENLALQPRGILRRYQLAVQTGEFVAEEGVDDDLCI